MDEPAEDDPSNDPIVILDDEEQDAAPPPRRRRWIWGALAGGLLLAALGSWALIPKGVPAATPVPIAATEIAFVSEAPTQPEPAPAPVESPLEDPSEVQPPAPPPPPQAKPEPVELAKAEPPPAEPPRRPPGETVAEAPAPPPPPPAPEESVTVEKELVTASVAIHNAEPLFREAAEGIDAALKRGDPRDVAAKMDRAEELLRDARERYECLRNQAPDPETVEARMAVLEELLDALKDGRARIRVPLALKEAEALEREAAPLAKEALGGFQPGSHDAQALDVKAEVAIDKLRGARERYLSVRHSAPDPKAVDKRLKNLDAQLERLEKRYPSLSAR